MSRWTIFALCSIVLTVAVIAYHGRPHAVQIELAQIGKGGHDLDMRRIRRDIEALSATSSRVTGYPGEESAYRYILRELKAMGAKSVEVQTFPVAVPIHSSASLEHRDSAGKSTSIPLHPVWPNLARTSQTPPEGLTGPLLDGGDGSDAALRGKAIAGALVVLDWDSQAEWLSVPEFGGRAVIFRGSSPASGMQAKCKFLSVAADVPRDYVAEADVPALNAMLHAGGIATVRCECGWQTVTARNILARICDGTPGGETAATDRTPIVFHAYYDSISVVPDLAPGAEQACGAAVLLELGRYLAAAGSPRPVDLLFTGGHGQALAGMTHYVRTVREKKVPAPGLMVGLDLSSRSESFGLFVLGHFRGQYEDLVQHKFSTLASELAKLAQRFGAQGERRANGAPALVDGVNPETGRGWWTYFPYRCAFESELPTLAAIPGVTLAAVNDDRRFVDTPDDTFQRLRLDLLERQIIAVSGERIGLAGIATAFLRWKGPFLNTPLDDEWSAIEGRAVWLDQNKDYTPNEPLAQAVVFLKTGRGDKYLMGTRGVPAAMTDAQGRYSFDGLIRSSANGQFNTCTLEVYGPATSHFLSANPEGIDQYRKVVERGSGKAGDITTDGSIIFAEDMAQSSDYPFTFATASELQHLNLVTFPCRSFTLFGLTDPRDYLPLSDVQVLDASTQSPPFQFGKSMPDLKGVESTENVVTLWADPTLRVLVTLGLGYQEKRLVLINNSPAHPQGKGFVLDEIKTLPSMVLQGARDMWNLDEARLGKLERNGVKNPRIRKLHADSAAQLKEAEGALAEHDYQLYRVAAGRAWALEGKGYSETLDLINNMIRGVLFYLALLAPLSYCLERLLVGSETIKKRVLWIGLIFSAGFLVLALVHPAFRFTLTPLLVLLAFLILAMVTTVGVLIVSRMDSVLQARKQATTGRHQDQYRRAGVAVRALDLGTSNIRRRPQRGFLTGLSVVTVTFILLSFTSLVPTTSISRLPHPRGTPSYRGMLSRDRAWNPLPDALGDALRRSYQNESGAVVAARAWFYSDAEGRLSLIDISDVSAQPRHITASALLCVEPGEAKITGVESTLVAGRWFKEADEPGIILSRHLAEQLGCGLGDIGRKVRLFGEELSLTGIVDTKRFDGLLDLDGEPLTPVDVVRQEAKTAQVAQKGKAQQKPDTLDEYIHFSADQIAIVPLSYGRQLRAPLRSVAVKAPAGMDTDAEASGCARRSNLTILASDGKSVLLYAALNTSQISAAWQVAIPLVLGFIMILGTMLGSVYERKGEIFVYNSVGLSPTNVSSLFIAESAVYAIVGAGAGYLLGQAASKILQATGWFPGLTVNYTAGTTILVTALAMGIVLLSALYPARQAFRAAIPDVERDPAAETDLGSDAADTRRLWLPFVATPGHVMAVQAYLCEYLESIQGVTIGQVAVDSLRARVEEANGRPVPILEFRAWMSPFDLGVSHDVQMKILWRPETGVYQCHMSVRLISGDRQNWRRLMPRFVQAIRKQLLMWRILSAEEHLKYQEAGARLFGAAAVAP